ncbi:MAG: heme ABC transporter permease [Alphaproteobacteria bacterium]|jgi:heme exporter protein C|nr:heme ABC transporter permease [Alphaproteobacteria bacterium]
MFDYFANPSRFNRAVKLVLPWLEIIAFGFLGYGLYLALLNSPADYQQGDAVRIMYIHVPAAWIALSSYLLLGICAFFFLIWRHPLAEIAASAIAPIGAGFSALTLITGSLWGKPIWGVWWVWDGRLTSMLVLFFFFIGYLALSNAFDQSERGARPAAILALIGCINLPIVKFSVDWWNTLHQPASIMRSGGIAIDSSMLSPLFTLFIAFQLFFIVIVLIRMQTVLNNRKIESHILRG